MLNAMKSFGTWKPRMHAKLYITIVAVLFVGVAWGFSAKATPQLSDDQGQQSSACAGLPGFGALKNALASATAAETSGLNNQMWATLVDRDGVVCAVAFSGVNRGAQWPGSRVISAQKANTAARRQPLRTAAQQSRRYRRRLRGTLFELWHFVRPDGQAQNRWRKRFWWRPGSLRKRSSARRRSWSEWRYFLRRPQHLLARPKSLGSRPPRSLQLVARGWRSLGRSRASGQHHFRHHPKS